MIYIDTYTFPLHQTNILTNWAAEWDFPNGNLVSGERHSVFATHTWIAHRPRPSSGWRWRQHGPLKCWYPTSLHSITTLKSMTWTRDLYSSLKVRDYALQPHKTSGKMFYI